MGGWASFLVAALVAGSALSAHAQVAAPVEPISACRFDVVGAGRVAKIVDGRSFLLEDQREVRLAAVEVPSLPGPDDAGSRAVAGLAAKSALEAILADQSVELRQRGSATDRYGRTVAHAYLTRAGAERSAAHDLLARGHARVAAKVGHAACAAELLARERTARAAGVGLWATPDHGILSAESWTQLLAEQGRFMVVEGKVLSVRESGGTIYMNFGRRWSQALTVTILKRDERMFAGAGLPPKALENRLVRVRGFVEERNGPRIEATRPEQIEIAELN
jgi:endonuclease YncB( thermonuclease family)